MKRFFLVCTVLLLVGIQPAAAQVSFAPAVNYIVGKNPRSVVAADVNGDGLVDLICANSGTNTLSVLTNNGNGGFVLATTLTVGIGPQWVIAADVNGDGKQDLISANSGTNTLSVLTNNGSGGFVLATTLTVGNGPQCVIAADVNGDGNIDLVTACFSQISVMINNGNGSFAPAASYGYLGDTWETYTSVTAADVKGDGNIDLICSQFNTNTLTVFTNNGSGKFSPNATLTVGYFPYSVTAADVNGDGDIDLICANAWPNTLSVLTNNGSGGFALASSPSVGNSPVSVTAADVNGDGNVDLICANYGNYGNTLSMLTNNGSAGFALACTLVVGTQPWSVTAADVNGDGNMDLISANYGNNTVSVLLRRL